MRYIVFTCRKCGHQMFAENTEDLAQKLKRLSSTDCPACSEDADEKWILSGTAQVFPEDRRRK